MSASESAHHASVRISPTRPIMARTGAVDFRSSESVDVVVIPGLLRQAPDGPGLQSPSPKEQPNAGDESARGGEVMMPLRAICDCFCVCGVPVRRQGARCRDCAAGRHCDEVTGLRPGEEPAHTDDVLSSSVRLADRDPY